MTANARNGEVGPAVVSTAMYQTMTFAARAAIGKLLFAQTIPSRFPEAPRDEFGAAGRLLHTTLDALGTMFVVDVWTSEEHWRDYRDHMAQLRAEAGVSPTHDAVYHFVDDACERDVVDFLRTIPVPDSPAFDAAAASPSNEPVTVITQYPLLTVRQDEELGKRLPDRLNARDSSSASLLKLPLASPVGDMIIEVFPTLDAFREEHGPLAQVWEDVGVEVDVTEYRFFGRSYEPIVDRIADALAASTVAR
jgi:hypothetical protein